MESGSTACTTPTTHDSTSGCGWSLKKSKRDAAQQRRAQAERSLKLRGRLQAQDQQQHRRQDTVARVDHQQHHLRRLKLQRSDQADSLPSPQQQLPADIDSGLPGSLWGFSKLLNSKEERDHSSQQACDGLIWSWGSKGATIARKSHQKRSMRAAVESRRRLARGPRSGSTSADAQSGAGGQPMLPSEDHRVVSTVFQAADTQALMRVTLLAAGFVIGARGISARLIGQVTGAIVQSWTEACRPDSVPIRLFRIQGKKAVVQSAVALIEQAVAKYKDLCECKRRGEFVQREHVINGVEFYYQPPPRKAFANSGNEPSRQAEDGAPGAQLKSPVATSAPIAPHHVWLQHLQQQQQQQQQQVQAVTAQQQKQQTHLSLLEASQVVKAEKTADCHSQDHSDILHQSHGFFDWQPQVERQLMGLPSSDLEPPQEGASEFELGLQQSVVSLEQALQQIRLEQHLLHRNRSMSSNNSNTDHGSFQLHHHGQTPSGIPRHNQEPINNLWQDTSSPGSRASRQAAATSDPFQLGPSLFFFGDGGLPFSSSLPDSERSDTDSNCIFLDAAPCSPFDFPHCDFLRESLPTFAWAAASREMPEYSLYEASPLQEDVGESFCIVCLEQPSCVHLVPCGHNLFCFSCVGGLLTCPLCRQPIVALHPRGKNPVTPEAVDLPSNLNASSYNMWNWIPGASV